MKKIDLLQIAKKNLSRVCLVGVVFTVSISNLQAQTKDISQNYSDFDTWMVREIRESTFIGGSKKELNEIGQKPNGDFKKNIPYVPIENNPWGTSNVWANVMAVSKASASVYPENRGDGKCAKLETHVESVKVFGLINIKALATGSIYFGQMIEPIKDPKNPRSCLIQGIKYTKHPKAVSFDYKLKLGEQRVEAPGIGSFEKISGPDSAEVSIILQHRWEDPDGSVHSSRVGTAWIRLGKDQEIWKNQFNLPIHYGDISNAKYYKSYMDLIESGEFYMCRNSKGEIVELKEDRWGKANEEVTHIIVRFSSSHEGAHYRGAPGSTFWIDNFNIVE